LPAAPQDKNSLTFVGCGSPLATVEVRIVDDGGHEASDRERGRIEFRGPSATAGYYRNPAATHCMRDHGWVNSGDVGYIADGELYVTGRTKDLIIRAGRNIHPQELEEAIGRIPGIRSGFVAAFGTHDFRSGTERLVVAAETRVVKNEDRERILTAISDLATELIETPPDDVLLVPPGGILKTPSGKVRRGACRELYEKGMLGRERPSRSLQLWHLALSGAGPWLQRFSRALGRLTYGVWSWGTAILFSGPVWLAIACLPSLAVRRALLQSTARLWLRLIGIRVAASGLSNIPKDRASLLTPNHSSYLDSFILAAVLPPRFVFLAKKELDRNAFISIFLRRLGTLFAEREDAGKGVQDTAAAIEAVRSGQGLVVYPEGTFRRAPGLRPFKIGAFLVAAQAGVPLLPVAIRGTRSILRDGQKVIRPGLASISIGAPLLAATASWQAAVQLRDRTREEILRGCGEPDLVDTAD
jgi:1-acyl-sn-glycerol-3-phosphate acyltransferase